jgi:2-polyprenyl-3-methyl-5-hydroxy-6-metoxy-1,4-benzoquinol methylase
MSLWSLPPLRTPELMDDPALAAADHLHALRALGTINAVSQTAARLAAAVRRVAAASGIESLHVVDVACGGGDVTLSLARRLGPASRVTGIDVSDRAIERARHVAADRGIASATFERRDVVAEGCPACDVVVTSLFLHHLDDPVATNVLAAFREAARVGVVVSDLLRSRVGLWMAILGTRLLTTSRIARIDGPLSVHAARTLSEHRGLCAAAGLRNARVTRVWPERVMIEWRRDTGEGS